MADTSSCGEFSLIDRFRRQAGSRAEVLVGIGDDAAVLDSPGSAWITAVDVLCEGVHFTRETALPLVGRKAMNVNVSDMAAMCALPCAAFIGLVLPRSFTEADVSALYSGLQEAAGEWDICLAGGDTNSWDGGLVISVTLLGIASSKGTPLRSGARPGDDLFVTGPLGGSLQSGRHLTFPPRVRESRLLQEHVELHSLMDLSDGLASDLFHLLEQSGVGARIDATAIPVHSDVDPHLPQSERIARALNDGEDFELLLTVSPEDSQKLLADPPVGVELFRIGEITAEPGAVIVHDGQVLPLSRGGWNHRIGE